MEADCRPVSLIEVREHNGIRTSDGFCGPPSPQLWLSPGMTRVKMFEVVPSES